MFWTGSPSIIGLPITAEHLSSAILDRVLHHSRIFSINGPGYRAKNIKTVEQNFKIQGNNNEISSSRFLSYKAAKSLTNKREIKPKKKGLFSKKV